ncbi:UNVERIFIED_CONTAM: hypothetical protein HDU68_009598 [Siphonaria sp. JEL0065]|nr:hypothetical protein HDU68_009598 [Siphonaria sp. JEL0065]
MNDGRKDIGAIPCNLLVALGLDTLTTEESFLEALLQFNIPITQIRLVKDRATRQSFGFGFIEFSDIQSAAYFLGLTATATNGDGGPCLVIDESSVSLAFASSASFVQVFGRTEWVTSFYQDSGRTVFLRYPPKPVATTTTTTFASIDDELAAFMNEVEGVEVEKTAIAGLPVLESVDGSVESVVYAGCIETSEPIEVTQPGAESAESGLGVHSFAPPVLSGNGWDKDETEPCSISTIRFLFCENPRLVMNIQCTQKDTEESYEEGESQEPLEQEQPQIEPIDLTDEGLLKAF